MIQINSRLKMVFWNLIQKFENLDLEYELVCLFGDVWSFLGLDSSVVPRIDSNQLIAQAVSRRVESIQLMIQVAFQGIDSESTHDSRRSPGIDSDRLMTQMAFQWIDSESTHDSNRSPGIESIRIMTQAKKNVDSGSTHDSTLSRTHVCLFVIGMLKWPCFK